MWAASRVFCNPAASGIQAFVGSRRSRLHGSLHGRLHGEFGWPLLSPGVANLHICVCTYVFDWHCSQTTRPSQCSARTVVAVLWVRPHRPDPIQVLYSLLTMTRGAAEYEAQLFGKSGLRRASLLGAASSADLCGAVQQVLMLLCTNNVPELHRPCPHLHCQPVSWRPCVHYGVVVTVECTAGVKYITYGTYVHCERGQVVSEPGAAMI